MSGPAAGVALERVGGPLPPPRMASLRVFRDPASGEMIDRGLALWFPGPASATGEDLAELHVHGGRAVVAAMLEALVALPGIRAALPGEFTRRSVFNGRMDLHAAAGLADLLEAETELQRRQALALAEGGLSRKIALWQEQLLVVSAQVEALIDFDGEDDVEESGYAAVSRELDSLERDLSEITRRPTVERLRDGIRVVIGGPPNAGKSSLINWLADREVAITSPQAGTTRDVIEAAVAMDGYPFVFTDTAGLREADDPVERIGVARANASLAAADIVLWMGGSEEAPSGAIILEAKADIEPPTGRGLAISVVDGQGLMTLRDRLVALAETIVGSEPALLNQQQRAVLSGLLAHVRAARAAADPLIVAEELRGACERLDRLTGRARTEDMLDRLFGRFCLGK